MRHDLCSPFLATVGSLSPSSPLLRPPPAFVFPPALSFPPWEMRLNFSLSLGGALSMVPVRRLYLRSWQAALCTTTLLRVLGKLTFKVGKSTPSSLRYNTKPKGRIEHFEAGGAVYYTSSNESLSGVIFSLDLPRRSRGRGRRSPARPGSRGRRSGTCRSWTRTSGASGRPRSNSKLWRGK